MPWYAIVALALFIIAPFDAFYQYNKLTKRREEQRRKQREQAEAPHAEKEITGSEHSAAVQAEEPISEEKCARQESVGVDEGDIP